MRSLQPTKHRTPSCFILFRKFFYFFVRSISSAETPPGGKRPSRFQNRQDNQKLDLRDKKKCQIHPNPTSSKCISNFCIWDPQIGKWQDNCGEHRQSLDSIYWEKFKIWDIFISPCSDRSRPIHGRPWWVMLYEWRCLDGLMFVCLILKIDLISINLRPYFY